MAVALTASFDGLGGVVVAFGDFPVVTIPLTEDEKYVATHTGTTEDEVAAEVAARWMRETFARTA